MTQGCNCHGANGKYSETIAAVLERPRYSPGLILEEADLTSAVEYTRELNRLLFRNLFGCGVVCGLTVGAKADCGITITVSAGVALDGCGDPVQLPRPVTINFEEDKVVTRKPDGTAERKPFWVILCGREKMCKPRPLVCDADEFDALSQPTRIRALSEVSIAFDEPKCVCKCQSKHGMPDAEGIAECHFEHETRTECADDCGCGTACACGCCVLLANVRWQDASTTQREGWIAVHKGVRRFIRPRMIDDPHGRRQENDAVAG